MTVGWSGDGALQRRGKDSWLYTREERARACSTIMTIYVTFLDPMHNPSSGWPSYHADSTTPLWSPSVPFHSGCINRRIPCIL